MEKIKAFFKLSPETIYKLKDWLYFLLSTSMFKKVWNNKVIGLSVFYMYMSISTFLVFYAGAYESQKGIDFGVLHNTLMWPFLIGAFLMCTHWITFRNNAPKSIQDKYWETQLVRFASPSFSFAKSLYPDANERYEVLNKMWEDKYGETFRETEENAPLFQTKLQFTVLIGLAILGIFLGIWIG